MAVGSFLFLKEQIKSIIICPIWATGVPLITIWDPVASLAGPGKDPNAWKQFGLKLTWSISLCPNG
jgi:hypothetical protein